MAGSSIREQRPCLSALKLRPRSGRIGTWVQDNAETQPISAFQLIKAPSRDRTNMWSKPSSKLIWAYRSSSKDSCPGSRPMSADGAEMRMRSIDARRKARGVHLCDIVVYLAAWLADRIWGQILKWPKSPDMGFESAYPISSSTI